MASAAERRGLYPKIEPYENGMLDVFFAYFSEAYDAASKKG